MLKFHACEKTIVLLFLSIGMSTYVNKEVLTSKRQGLSEEEGARERERARNNRQLKFCSAAEREREKERAREKRCRNTEVQREREQGTQLIYG